MLTRGLNIQHGELDEVGDGGEGLERCPPVHRRRNLDGLQGSDVEEMEGVSNAGADGQRVDVAELPRLFGRNADEIVFA